MGVALRGDDSICGRFFSYIDLEKRVRVDHPLRVIRQIANAAHIAVWRVRQAVFADGPGVDPAGAADARIAAAGVLFDPLGAAIGRQIDTDLLFRWFFGLGIEDAVWDATNFMKNRDRLLGWRGGGQVSHRGAVARQGQALAVERALLRRRPVA
jgi:hypothetical protein